MTTAKLEALMRNIILHRRLPFTFQSVSAAANDWHIVVCDASGATACADRARGAAPGYPQRDSGSARNRGRRRGIPRRRPHREPLGLARRRRRSARLAAPISAVSDPLEIQNHARRCARPKCQLLLRPTAGQGVCCLLGRPRLNSRRPPGSRSRSSGARQSVPAAIATVPVLMLIRQRRARSVA